MINEESGFSQTNIWAKARKKMAFCIHYLKVVAIEVPICHPEYLYCNRMAT